MMIGWRRKAKAERARLENPMSPEHLYDLVNQTLLANFGPLGSYAITRRATSDSDDIFHTMLASSVAHDIVGALVNHHAVPLLPPSVAGGSFVAATAAFATTHALPAEPLGTPDVLSAAERVGAHAAVHSTHAADVVAEVVAEVASAPVPAASAFIPAPAPAPAPALVSVPARATSANALAPGEAAPVAAPVPAAESVPGLLAPIVAVPVSADLAAALTVLDETGAIALPAPIAAVRTHLVDAGR